MVLLFCLVICFVFGFWFEIWFLTSLLCVVVVICFVCCLLLFACVLRFSAFNLWFALSWLVVFLMWFCGCSACRRRL